MSYIVVMRNPTTKKPLAVTDDDGEIADFETEDAAVSAAARVRVCEAWGYQVVEID
jgi:hypothetical protein